VLPRATLFSSAGTKEWTSTIVRRYQRRMPEVNEAVATSWQAATLAGFGSALQPLLKAAPLSKSAVARVVATLKSDEALTDEAAGHSQRRGSRPITSGSSGQRRPRVESSSARQQTSRRESVQDDFAGRRHHGRRNRQSPRDDQCLNAYDPEGGATFVSITTTPFIRRL
jgi:hypothetical protein